MRLFAMILILFLSSNLLFGKSISILQYNLYEPKDKGISDFRKAKEVTAKLLLEQLSIDVFSFTEEINADEAMRQSEYTKNERYDYLTLKTPYYTSYLCYRRDKIELKSSKVYEMSKYAVCVYEMSCEEGKSFFLFVYRQNKRINTNQQHQWILDFIEKKGLKERIVLLGGGDEKEKKGVVEPKVYKDGIPLISMTNGSKLVSNQEFQWTPQLNTAYFSSDLFEDGKSVNLEYADVGYIFSENGELGLLEVVPFNTYNITYKEEKEPVFEYPKVTIVSQNETDLVFSVTWDSEEYVKVETISMIGNNFYNNIFLYEGVKKTYTLDISGYPTGIYMIRSSSGNDKMALRRFTVY